MTTPTPIPILRYRPQAEGLERWFHPLELAIMTALWDAGRPRTVKQVWQHLRREYRADIAYTTVASTLMRLAEKGMLCRTGAGAGPAHLYHAPCSQAEFVEIQVRAIRTSLEDCYAD